MKACGSLQKNSNIQSNIQYRRNDRDTLSP